MSSKLHKAARVTTDENVQLCTAYVQLLGAIARHMPHMVDQCDRYGVTPLWDASRRDNTAAMRILLGAKAGLV